MTKTIKKTENCEEVLYNRIVGIKDDCVDVLERVFKYADGMHGATGYRMRLITPSEIQKYQDEDITEYYEDLWRQAVQAGSTTDSLEEWSQAAWDEEQENNDSLFPGDWDHSDVQEFREAVSELCFRQFYQYGPSTFEDFIGWWADFLDTDSDELLDRYASIDCYNEPEEDTWEDVGVFRTAGGGRMFDPGYKPDIVLDKEALDIIHKAEEGNGGH